MLLNIFKIGLILDKNAKTSEYDPEERNKRREESSKSVTISEGMATPDDRDEL
jgi:hypothetical protein